MSEVNFYPKRETKNPDKYGTFCAASYFGDHECVAYHVQYLEEKKENLRKEIERVKSLKLNHSNVVPFFEIQEDVSFPNSVFFVMENIFVKLNSFLLQHASSNNSHLFHLKICMLQNIVCGLSFLHKRLDVIHSDLSTGVIFLYGLIAKVAYFGEVKDFAKGSKLYTSFEDVCYWPPEAFVKNSKITKMFDIFSFGCIAIEMITHQKPIPDVQFLEETCHGTFIFITEAKRRERYLKRIKEDSKWGKLPEIIERCLQNIPDDRLETSRLCQVINVWKDGLLEGKKIKQQKSFMEYGAKIKENYIQSKYYCSMLLYIFVCMSSV